MRRARRGGGKHPRLRARPMASPGDQAEVAVGLRWTSPTSSSRGGSRSPPQGVPGELRWPLPREAATLALQSPSSLTLAAQKGMAIANVLQSVTTAEMQRAQALARPAVVGHAAAAGPPWRGTGPAPAQDRLAEHRSRRDAIGVKAQECRMEERELKSELEAERRGCQELALALRKAVPVAKHDQIVQQLSHGYRQLCQIQEDKLFAEQRAKAQAQTQLLVELESQVCDREREAILSKQSAQKLVTVKLLTTLENRRCNFLQKQMDEQSMIFPWLREKQAQLEEYKLLSTVYQDELRAATETVESLRCESQVWERRILEEVKEEAARRAPPGLAGGVSLREHVCPEEADRCPVAGCCCNGGHGARGAARGGATTPCGARVADPLLFHGEPGGAGGASPPVRDGEPRVPAPPA